MEEKQIKSKNRVSEHGEVFTHTREVNAMLDMIDEIKNNIESTVLEPACGNGNFLIEVLVRKINMVETRYKRIQEEFEKWAFIAVSSLYGVDLLEDNIIACRRRLYDYVSDKYNELYKKKTKKDYLKIIEYILSKNIVCGNALTLRDNNKIPITFSEWKLVTKNMVKRSDFVFSKLLDPDETDKVISDIEKESYINTPIKEYKPIHYRRLMEYESY